MLRVGLYTGSRRVLGHNVAAARIRTDSVVRNTKIIFKNPSGQRGVAQQSRPYAILCLRI